MADFDPLSNAEGTDPVADFLDREEKQLAELNEIGDLTANAAVGVEGTSSNPGESNADFFAISTSENFGKNEVVDVKKDQRGMDDDSSRFDRYEALKEDGPPRIETDKICKWREEQKERLAIKDADSEKKQKEWLQVAQQELEEYEKHRGEQLIKTKKSNRDGEVVFIRERDEKKPGGEWERVCRFCDFNPKTATRPTKDISRLRSLLLQLKQTPNVSFMAA